MDKKSEKHSDIEIEDVQVTWTEKEEATVRWLVDFRVVPIIFVLYLLCFLDRYVLVKPFDQLFITNIIDKGCLQSEYWVRSKFHQRTRMGTVLIGRK
jgi:hypothetical protein